MDGHSSYDGCPFYKIGYRAKLRSVSTLIGVGEVIGREIGSIRALGEEVACAEDGPRSI